MKLLTICNLVYLIFLVGSLNYGTDLEYRNHLLSQGVISGFFYILLVLYISETRPSKIKSTDLNAIGRSMVYFRSTLLCVGLVNALIVEYFIWFEDAFYSELVVIFAGLTFLACILWFFLFNPKIPKTLH